MTQQRSKPASYARGRGRRFGVATVAGGALAILAATVALAVIVDLTNQGDVEKIDEAIYRSYNPADATGSGTFDAFVRISANAPVVEGYNTDYRPLQYDENNAPGFTRSYRLSNVPLVNDPDYPGAYREFQLDINQTAGNAIYSLDEVEVYLTENPSISGHPFPTDPSNENYAEKVYELDKIGEDATGQNSVQLNYNLAAGSGQRDMILRIPSASFMTGLGDDPACTYAGPPPAGADCDVFIVLYSRFGGDIEDLAGNDDGFEEWGVELYDLATKSGMKFHDLDADGVKDAGEPGLGGWVIYVDYDGDGTRDVGEPFATTASDGTYEITGIVPGTYKVREEGQSGWTCSFPNAGTETAPVTSTQCWYEETFEEGADLVGNDFGNWTTASKTGMKFHDLDADGVKDAGEPGLGGWVIYVDYDNDSVRDAGEPFATTSSDAGTLGQYTITGINPGTWNVREEGQTGWTCSYPNAGTEAAPVTSTQCWYSETFESGDALTNNDFGNWTTASKSGFKFYDNDTDGVFEPLPDLQNDTKLSGWVIELWRWSGSAWVFHATDTTDGTGYSFSGLAPGTYAVCEIMQVNYVQSFPHAGATLPAGESVFDCTVLTPNGGGTFGAFGIQFTATSGASLENNLFGNFLVPPGCTLTQGYWKTHSEYGPAAHPDDTWDLLPDGPDTLFFDSGDTWYEVFWTNPKGGNAWYILAHQYMAAQLNLLNGAGMVPGLADALADAEALLNHYDTQQNIPKNADNVLTDAKDRAEAIAIADFLASYNEGFEGVPHCGEPGFTGFTTLSSTSGGWVLPPLLPIRRRRMI